jgi:hypothetical protein
MQQITIDGISAKEIASRAIKLGYFKAAKQLPDYMIHAAKLAQYKQSHRMKRKSK